MNNHQMQLTLKRLTAAGRSALASLLVEGPGAIELVDRFFQTKTAILGKRPSRLMPGDKLFVGLFHDGGGDDPTSRDHVGEEIVVCCRSDSCVELNCHGGSASVERIESILASHGCRIVDWRDDVGRHCSDHLQAAAFIALTKAETPRTAAVLLDQYQGSLRRGIESILSALSDKDLATAIKRLRSILAWADFGLHLTEPWRVVLAGQPNVGKSTLMNALAGYRRAIVHHVPGTTRDVLTVSTALDGWPVLLADTAGLRSTDDDIERCGVRLAAEELQAADLVLLVFDASAPWTADDDRLCRCSDSTLIVHNKTDLCDKSQLASVLQDRPTGVALSALDGTNIEQLATAIAQRLVPHAPPPLVAVPFTSDQTTALQATLSALKNDHTSADNLAAAREVLESLLQGK